MVGRASWEVCVTVSKWCGNTVQPDLKTLALIAKCLNVKVADLIKEPNEEL